MSTELKQVFPASRVVIADYINDELGTDTLPEFVPADTGNIEESAPALEEKKPAIADRKPVFVEGKYYSASRDRLYLVSKSGEKSIENFVSSLIVIVADARDNASSNWGKVVRFEDRDGVKKEQYISNSDITTNGKSVVKAMVEEGLLVSTDSRMEDALLHYLNMAPPLEKKKAVCTDRIGWHGNSYLLPDNSVIGGSETRVVYTGAPIGNHHAIKGTVEEWKNYVAALCRGNSMLIFAVCISFASVLLRLLKIESGGFHIFGESSTGKSITLYVGASIHGEPEGQIATWDSTSVGDEGKAKQCNDSLSIRDELHQSNPKDAGKVAYKLFNGKGRVRGNVLGGAQNVAEWRLNCLSSGEVSFASFIQDGGNKSRAGQEVRMIDISADMGHGLGIFENIHGAKNSHAFAEKMKKASLTYYGTPIRIFLEQLVGKIDDLEPDSEHIKKLFFEEFVPSESSGQVQRVATKFSVAALAGELATDIGITGWSKGEAYLALGSCFTRWLGARGTTGQQEAEKAVDQVKNFLLRHGMSRFIPVMFDIDRKYVLRYPDRPYSNMAGYRFTTSDDTYEFIVSPDVYKNEMCQGLNCQYVTNTLVEREYLKVEPDGKPQVRRRLPGMGQSRVYHFNPTIFGEADEFENAEPETEEHQ